VLFATFVSCVTREELLRQGYTEETGFLQNVYSKDNEHYYLQSEIHQKANFDYFTSISKSQESEGEVNTIGFWDFIPFEVATLYVGQTFTWRGICFRNVSATLTGNSTSGEIELHLSDKASALCNDVYDFGDREHAYLKVFVDGGKHTIKIDSWKEYEWNDIQSYGLHVFLFPGPIEDIAASVALTLSLFFDPNPLMVDENVKFIEQNMQWHMIERKINQVNVSKSDIRSGDYLGIMRLDGLDPLIMWGIGSHTGHTAVALWFEDDLYICESTDTEGLPALIYWPPPYGIIRTPYDQWIQQAMEANYHVVLLPLAEEYSRNFNEEQARNWFYSVEGMPYGWHNFLFTFLDTVANNLPRPITPDFFEHVMGVVERLIPIDQNSSVYSMLIQGLNLRLNSNCTTLQCIYDIIDPIPMSLSAAVAIPEQDSWRYGGNYSMVCDVFVCEMWKNGGIFGEFKNDFECTEQTPKDTYQFGIFDGFFKRPIQCVEADMSLPYCQLMGKYTLTLPGYNSINMYPEINNACPAVPPVYERPPIC